MPHPVNLMDRNSKKKKRFSSIPIVISGLKRSEPRSVSTDIRFIWIKLNKGHTPRLGSPSMVMVTWSKSIAHNKIRK